MPVAERYDRQARIEGWDQSKISGAAITIVGLNPLSEYVALASAALGIGRIRMIQTPHDAGGEAPYLALSSGRTAQQRLSDMSEKLGCREISFLKAHMRARAEEYFLLGSDAVIDAAGSHESRALCLSYGGKAKGAESALFYNDGFSFLSINASDDPFVAYEKEASSMDSTSAMIAAGAMLEEVKKNILGQNGARQSLSYEMIDGMRRENYSKLRALVVGAGALGNFVVPGLAGLGVGRVTTIDPDVIEESNLSRQILFYEAVGEQKARVLANRCEEIFDKGKIFGKLRRNYRGIADKFDRKTALDGYDAVFDCVDNFETRIAMSERCAAAAKPLISGGTSPYAGQVVAYVPKKTACPKHALDLERIAAERTAPVEAGCIVQPDASVIMSNMVTAGMMLNEFRRVFSKGNSRNTIKRYEAFGLRRFGEIPAEPCGD